MTNTPNCTLKYPHSHLVNGAAFPCEKGTGEDKTITVTGDAMITITE